MPKYAVRITLVAAAVTVISLFGLAAGGEDVPLLTVLGSIALLIVTVASANGRLGGPRWLPGVFGAGMFALMFTVDSTAGLFDTLSFLGCVVWTAGGFSPILLGMLASSSRAAATGSPPALPPSLPPSPLPQSPLLQSPLPPSPAAAASVGAGRLYWRRPAGAYRLVLAGMAIAFLSLFLQWEAPTPFPLLQMRQVGSVTNYVDSTGRVVRRTDTRQTVPDYKMIFTGGYDGFEEAGPLVIIALLLYAAAGFVGLRITAPAVSAAVALLGLAALAWNAVGNLFYPGMNAGTLLYLGGIALAVVGGLRVWLPALRSRRSGHSPG